MEIAAFPVVIADSVFLFQSGCNYVISLNKDGAEFAYDCAECFFKFLRDKEDILSLYRLYSRFCMLYSVFFLFHPYTCANYAIMRLISGIQIFMY